MNEQSNANEQVCRACWINCGVQPDAEMLDIDVLASLGQAIDLKRWLAASMDKTMRLQLYAPSDFWLQFG